MIYYRVKPEHDNKRVLCKQGKSYVRLALIGNELFTQKELNNLHLTHEVMTNYCDVVNVNRNNTYYSFGARFSIDAPYSHEGAD